MSEKKTLELKGGTPDAGFHEMMARLSLCLYEMTRRFFCNNTNIRAIMLSE